MKKIKKVFLVGHPRSGTTLLAAVLGRNPLITSTPESHYFNKVRFLIEGKKPENIEALKCIFQCTRLSDWKLDWDMMDDLLTERKKWTSSNIFDATIETYGRINDKGIVLEKTPVHIRYIENILRWYPDARVIWIQRDGRGAVNSLRNLDWATSDLRQLCWQWNLNMAFGCNAKKLFPSSVYTIKYESLMEMPMETLVGLHEFLGVTYEPVQLLPTECDHLISSSEDAWKNNIKKIFMPERAIAWRNEMPSDDIKYITSAMGYYLYKLNYISEQEFIDSGLARYFFHLMDKKIITDGLLRLYASKQRAWVSFFGHTRR